MRLDDRVIGGVAALGGGAYAAVAFGLPTLPGQPYGPGFFPSIIGVAMTLAGVGLLVRGFRAAGRTSAMATAGAGAGGESEEAGTGFPTIGGIARYLAVLAAVIFYILASPHVGFVIAAFVIMVALALAFGEGVVRAVIVALAVTILLAVLFGHLLRVPLPPGPIGFL
ncbi:tripartite tricarboxylate transporter TctB family protein [Acuticoccus kandeliae]|uniref:tripartite tricarboxylate transporter TctB family protein n=1 Tax=Acuticoccus kandeliae TaxID=2073160 RepID=UPI000D3E0C6A|nr:tripartite tricarboxylate transporter TctB family protein [Acuticoccus kandeliae]